MQTIWSMFYIWGLNNNIQCLKNLFILQFVYRQLNQPGYIYCLQLISSLLYVSFCLNLVWVTMFTCSLVSNFTISAWSAIGLSWPGLGYTTGMTALISCAFLWCGSQPLAVSLWYAFQNQYGYVPTYILCNTLSTYSFTHRVGVWCGFYHLLSNTDDSFHITTYTTLFYIKIKVWLMIL